MFTRPPFLQWSYANSSGLMHSMFFASPFGLWYGKLSFVVSDLFWGNCRRTRVCCLRSHRSSPVETKLLVHLPAVLQASTRRPIPSHYTTSCTRSIHACYVMSSRGDICIFHSCHGRVGLAAPCAFCALRFVIRSYIAGHYMRTCDTWKST